MYYLDTNICSYFLKGSSEKVLEKLSKTKSKDIRIPSIVKAELLYGAYKCDNKNNIIERITLFLNRFEIEEFDSDMAVNYAEIRANLEKEGIPIGPNDLLIASIVLTKGGILVTNNEKEFSRIPGLRVENWSK